MTEAYRLSSDTKQQKELIDWLRKEQQMTKAKVSKVAGINYFTNYNFNVRNSGTSASNLVKMFEALGYKVIIVPEDENIIDYDSENTNVTKVLKEEPTREEVFRLLQKWYKGFNQVKLAEALGISQPAISKFLNK